MSQKTYLNNLIRNIFEDNYAEAEADLKKVINEKIKTRMKTIMIEKKLTGKEIEDGDEVDTFEKTQHKKFPKRRLEKVKPRQKASVKSDVK